MTRMVKLEEYLQNNEVCYWLVNGKIKVGLNLNSDLQELVKFLLKKLNIQRAKYGPIELIFKESKYDDKNFNQMLADIGIQSHSLIVVGFTTFPTFPMRPNTLRDRDLNIEYKDGIRFKLSLRNKAKFILERYLANIEKNGTSYLDILEIILAGTNNPIEINEINRIIEEIKDLNHSYLSGIRRRLETLFLL